MSELYEQIYSVTTIPSDLSVTKTTVFWTYFERVPQTVATLLKYNNCSLQQNWLIVWTIWIISLTIMASTVWAPHIFLTHEYNRIETSIYYGLHRHAWSLGLCWVIFACTQGYGGKVICKSSYTSL